MKIDTFLLALILLIILMLSIIMNLLFKYNNGNQEKIDNINYIFNNDKESNNINYSKLTYDELILLLKRDCRDWLSTLCENTISYCWALDYPSIHSSYEECIKTETKLFLLVK